MFTDKRTKPGLFKGEYVKGGDAFESEPAASLLQLFFDHITAAEVNLQPAVVVNLDALDHLPDNRVVVLVNVFFPTVDNRFDPVDFSLIVRFAQSALVDRIDSALELPDLIVDVFEFALAGVEAPAVLHVLADQLQHARIQSVDSSLQEFRFFGTARQPQRLADRGFHQGQVGIAVFLAEMPYRAHNRVLKLCFVDRGRFFTVFGSVLESAHTAPYNLLVSLTHPCASAETASAFSAFQNIRQGVFRVFADDADHVLGSLGADCVSLGEFFLRLIEDLPTDDCGVIILNQIHRRLAPVGFPDLGDAVDRDRFLKDQVAGVLLVFQDADDHRPVKAKVLSFKAVIPFLHDLGDLCNCFTRQEQSEDFFDDLCFFRYDLRLSVASASVSEQVLVADGAFSVFEFLSECPCNVFAHALRFGLSKAGVDDKVKLAVGFQRVDLLLFKEDPDAARFQHSDVLEAFHGVPREARHRFGDDHVDLTGKTVVDHLLEFRAFVRPGTRDPLVGV